MGAIKYFYIGSCENEECSQKGGMVDFPVPYEKVEAFRHEPPTCSECGKRLFGDVVEDEEEKEYR